MGIILRQNKGSELTFAEVDGNFQSLYYSSSLSGSDLQFFFASSSTTHSIDLTNVPGFTGITVQSGSTTIDTGVQTLNFLGSGVASIVQSGTDGVDITISGGGGGGGSTGIFQQSASSDVYFATSSLLITGSTILESPFTTTGSNITASDDGTGGGVAKYAMAISESIWHYTDNVGVPTSKAWKTDLEGSVFNRYDHNTDTAEILRFIATQLSESSPDSLPNNRTWSSTNIDFSIGSSTAKSSYMTGVLGGSTTYTNARLSQDWDDSLSINMALTQSYRDVQTYLISKGWLLSTETGSQTLHDVGTHPFGISSYGTNIPSTIRNQFSTFTFNADSVAAGSTVFSSSIGAQAFGMGELENPTTVTPYSASVFLTQSFSDNSSDTTPTEASTFSTNSISTYIINVEDLNGDANGLFLGIIPSSNADPQFQDGKFLNSPAGYTGRKWSNTDGDGTTGASTSSIGYYRIHGINYGLKTGSQASFSYQTPASTTNGFYMPSLSTLGVVNITQNDPTVTINNNLTRTSFSADSRSLSGAPYISASAYTFDYDTDVSKSFDPCYGYSQTPIQTSNPTDQWDTIGSTLLEPTSVTVNTNGIQTSTADAGVFPAGSNPAGRRSTNSIPSIADVSFLSSSFSFTLDANYNNVVQLSSSQHTINYDLTFRTRGNNWKGSTQTTTTTAEKFYDAALFGQTANSGSMAIYGRAQGYDAGSKTGTTTFAEAFSGESYRIKITDNLLTGSYDGGDKFTTGSYDIGLLSTLDLQVKPGYLVTPGGTYGYWLPPVAGANNYQYYARVFQRALTTGASNITASFGKALNAWDSTADGVSVAFLFSGSGADVYSSPRIFDPATTVGDALEVNIANDDFKNPFSDPIDLYACKTGTIEGSGASTEYRFPLLNGNGMELSNIFRDFVVIIRYKGDPSPISSIDIDVA